MPGKRTTKQTNMEEEAKQTSAQAAALLILDLSSLDAYTDLCGSAAGEALGYVLEDAVEHTTCTVFLTDQEWEYSGRASRPRQHFHEVTQNRTDIVRIHFDEDTEEWDRLIEHLGTLFRERQITSVILGGLWATADGSSGGVNEAKRLLEGHGFRCYIDQNLCGMDEDSPQL
jgi:hypothetical protein